jgi:carbon monoxide dehydrogenase subunit G
MLTPLSPALSPGGEGENALVRSTGIRLLLILLLPAAFIGLMDLPGPAAPGGTASRASGGVALVLALAGGALFASGRAASIKPSNRIDEQTTERLRSTIAYGLAFAIAAFAVIIALAVPVQALTLIAVAAAWVLIWWPRSMRRLATTTGVVIGRDPEVVFAFLSDFRTQLQYMPGVASAEKLTDGPIGVGTQFRTRARLRKGVLEVVEMMTDYEPNARYASRVVTSTHPNAGTATFERVAGGTRATFRYESELSHTSALLGMGLTRWLLQRRMIARRLMVWARVKQILESQAQPTA